MFSLNDAVKRGISRVRQPNWANPMDHLKIDVFPDGTHGPWIRLYSTQNKAINGRDPVSFLWVTGLPGYPNIDPDAKGLYAYTGPLPDSEEYKREEAEFTAFVENQKANSE